MAAACEQEAAKKEAAHQSLWDSMSAEFDNISSLAVSEMTGCAVGIQDRLNEAKHLRTLQGLLQRCAAAYATELQTAQKQFASLP
jgi:hypothetical protein